MKLKKFQMGGAMPEEQSMAQVPVEETAPAEQPQEGGGSYPAISCCYYAVRRYGCSSIAKPRS